MPNWTITFYTTSDQHTLVEEFIDDLPPKVQARFAHVFDLLETYGLLVGRTLCQKHSRGAKDGRDSCARLIQ